MKDLLSERLVRVMRLIEQGKREREEFLKSILELADAAERILRDAGGKIEWKDLLDKIKEKTGKEVLIGQEEELISKLEELGYEVEKIGRRPVRVTWKGIPKEPEGRGLQKRSYDELEMRLREAEEGVEQFVYAMQDILGVLRELEKGIGKERLYRKRLAELAKLSKVLEDSIYGARQELKKAVEER